MLFNRVFQVFLEAESLEHPAGAELLAAIFFAEVRTEEATFLVDEMEQRNVVPGIAIHIDGQTDGAFHEFSDFDFHGITFLVSIETG